MACPTGGAGRIGRPAARWAVGRGLHRRGRHVGVRLGARRLLREAPTARSSCAMTLHGGRSPSRGAMGLPVRTDWPAGRRRPRLAGRQPADARERVVPASPFAASWKGGRPGSEGPDPGAPACSGEGSGIGRCCRCSRPRCGPPSESWSRDGDASDRHPYPPGRRSRPGGSGLEAGVRAARGGGRRRLSPWEAGIGDGGGAPASRPGPACSGLGRPAPALPRPARVPEPPRTQGARGRSPYRRPGTSRYGRLRGRTVDRRRPSAADRVGPPGPPAPSPRADRRPGASRRAPVTRAAAAPGPRARGRARWAWAGAGTGDLRRAPPPRQPLRRPPPPPPSTPRRTR